MEMHVSDLIILVVRVNVTGMPKAYSDPAATRE